MHDTLSSAFKLDPLKIREQLDTLSLQFHTWLLETLNIANKFIMVSVYANKISGIWIENMINLLLVTFLISEAHII